MFANILGKTKKETSEDKTNSLIFTKISKMNLSDMRVYVNNKLLNFEVCEDGLSEIMRKLVSKDAKDNRFIESDAMDTKIKKAFELVIIVGASKKVTIVTTELIQEFIELYEDIISKFDMDHKQIYASKLQDALSNSLATLEKMTEINKKIKILSTT